MGAAPSSVSSLSSTISTSLSTRLVPTTLSTVTVTKPVATASVSSAAPVATSSARYIFTFGDSYTDTGFNVSNTWPSQSNPFGNPAWPGLTSCAGPNWLDDLLLASPVNTLSYNFAVGGSTVDNRYAQLFGGVNPFNVQVPRFINSGVAASPRSPRAQWTSANSVFMIWFGVNDVDITVAQNPQVPEVVEKIMTSYFDTVVQLYNAGARNFVMMGVAPLYRAPQWVTSPLVANVTAECAHWNTVLSRRVARFHKQYPRANAYYLDTQPFFNVVLNNPTAYGLPPTLCANEDGVSCPYQDGIHPSQAIHRSVASGVGAFLVSTGFLPTPGTVPTTVVPTVKAGVARFGASGNSREALYNQELCIIPDACP